MEIFDSPFLRIQYHEDMHAITEEWKLDFTTVVEGDTFREPLQNLLRVFKEKKVEKWLCDNTEQKTIASPDQIWLEEYYYPELVNLGLHRAALVNAKNILGTDYAKNCLQNANNKVIRIEVFNKNIDARDWIKIQ